MTKPVKYKGPQVLDDEEFAEIEGVLDLILPERLRERLSSSFFDYLWSCHHRPPHKAAVSERLKAMKKAALELRKTLTEDPIEAAARAAAKAAMDELFEKYHGKTIPGDALRATMRALLEKLPDSTIKVVAEEDFKNLSDGDDKALQRRQSERILDERAVRYWVEGQILRRTGIDVADLAEQLDQLCAFIDAREKSKGGRPRDKAWDELMLNLAAAYEEATGKQATVTENEHRAGAGERYSGPFVRVAAIVDQEATSAVSFTGVTPRPNSALGPALQRVLKSRRTRERSKTN
jgi:hypothetical protein